MKKITSIILVLAMVISMAPSVFAVGSNPVLTFDNVAKRTSYSKTQQVWEENGITVTNDKGVSTNDIGDYYYPVRCYKNTSLTVAYTQCIEKIIFSCNDYKPAYTTALVESITDAEVAVDGTVVTVTLATPATSYTFEKLSGQVRINSIEIVPGESNDGDSTPDPDPTPEIPEDPDPTPEIPEEPDTILPPPDSIAIVGSGLMGIAEWDPADPAGDMTKISDYVYQITLPMIAGKEMVFKFTGNDIWDDRYTFGGIHYIIVGEPCDLINSGGSANMSYIPDTNGRVIFTLDLTEYLYGTGDAKLMITIADLPENSCGINATWTLEGGMLTISGTGEMFGYGYDNMPWYEQRESIASVVVEEGITSIGAYAFSECDSLTQVVLPEGLLEIGRGAFEGCDNLREIRFPSTVEKIFDPFVFTPVTELYIPASVVYLAIDPELAHLHGFWVDENNLYYSSDEHGVLFDKNKTALLAYPTGKEGGSYTVPSTVTTIAYGAFKGVNLDALILNEGLLTIEGAFFNADIKSGLVIPSTVTNFNPSFDTNSGVFRIPSITFLGNVPNYDYVPFAYVTATVYYPSWNTTWTEVARLEMMSGIDTIWAAMEGDFKASGSCGVEVFWTLDEDGILTIGGKGAMYDFAAGEAPWYGLRSEISSIVIQEGVTAIGDYAFFNCYQMIADLSLPMSLEYIDKQAFAGGTALTEVVFRGHAPSIAEDAFSGVDATMYYSVNATGWTEEQCQNYGGSLIWLAAGEVCAHERHDHGGICHGCGFYQEHDYQIIDYNSGSDCRIVTTYRCTGCHGVYTETDVNHDYVWIVEGTCITEGVWTWTCTVCGNSYESYGYGSHSYSTEQTGQGTCITEEVWTYTCAYCGDSYDISLGYGQHRYSDDVCLDCGAVKPALPVVYFRNTAGFATPYVYTWTYIDGKPVEYNGSWPGEPMEKVPGTEDLYYMYLDPDAENIIFNGNGVHQTADLLIPTNGRVLFSWDTQSWSAYDGPCIHTNHNTSGICIICGEVAGHAFLDGSCRICGCAERVVQPTIDLKYPTLLLQDEIIMNVYFDAYDLDDVMEIGIITYSQQVESWSVDTAEGIRCGYQWGEAEGYYYVTTNGIAAKDIGSPIYFSIYAKLSNGEYVYTKLVSYSPSTYAYNVLQQPTTEVPMKALLVSMLNYGTAAQNYFGLAVDDPMNGDLTAELQALVDGYDISQITAVQRPDAAKSGAFASTGTGFGEKRPSITLGGTFAINYYFSVTNPVADDVTLYYWTAEDYAQAEVLTAENATGSMVMTGDGTYTAIIDGIAAKDIDAAVYAAAVYSDGTATHCTGVLPYSIGTYCKTHMGTDLEALAVATAAYGYFASSYFAD